MWFFHPMRYENGRPHLKGTRFEMRQMEECNRAYLLTI